MRENTDVCRCCELDRDNQCDCHIVTVWDDGDRHSCYWGGFVAHCITHDSRLEDSRP